jgi:isopentenyldiphosphate isomerase
MEEWFPLVDESGIVIGKASRSECHGGGKRLHPVVHLHIFNRKGDWLLQKRSASKDIQPGRWDTSVGGHLNYGETVEEALRREAREELGIEFFEPVFLRSYIFESDVEREKVYAYQTVCDGPFVPDPAEVDEICFWSAEEIRKKLGMSVFTPHFEEEFLNIKQTIYEY